MIAWVQTDAAPSPFEPGSSEEQGALLVFGAFLLSFWFVHRMARRFLEPRLLGVAPVRGSAPAFEALDVVAVIVLFFMGQVLAPALYAVAATGSMDVGKEFFEGLPVEALLGLSAGAMAVPCLYVAFLGLGRPRVLDALGVRAHVRGAKGTYSVARYLALLPFILGLGLVVQLAYSLAGADPPVQDVALKIQEGLEGASPWLIVFAVGVVPLIEEVLFRGFLLEFIRERAGDLAGIVLSSLLFAVMHGTAAALPIFGLACLLASIKLRTRSLYAAWLIHAMHNGLQTLLLSAGVSP